MSTPKSHIKIGTLGQVEHGKTTLTAALTTVLAKKYGGKARGFDEVDDATEEVLRGIPFNASHVEYETASRHYTHVDCPGNDDYTKGMISGAVQMDAAILVVSATEGPMPQTKGHIMLAQQVGIHNITVFLNQCDMLDDEDMLELTGAEIRGLLTQFEFPGDNVPVIRGSALLALEGEAEWEEKIVQLAGALDSFIPEPSGIATRPPLLPVEEVLSSDNVELVMPGDHIQMGVTLAIPTAMENGVRFDIREDGRVVGVGLISRIIR